MKPIELTGLPEPLLSITIHIPAPGESKAMTASVHVPGHDRYSGSAKEYVWHPQIAGWFMVDDKD